MANRRTCSPCARSIAPSPNDGELLIDVHTAGLSFPDLLRVRSQYQIPLPLGQPPGFEFVGTVSAGRR